MASRSSKPSEAPLEAPSGDMGVIRYNVPSPIQTYRMQRQRRQDRFRTAGRPLLIAACLAMAVPVGVFTLGKLDPSAPVAQASVSEAEKPLGEQASNQPLANTLPAASLAAAPEGAAASAPAAPETSVASAPQIEERVVVVKSGDTLGAIAKRHRLSVNEIVRYNGLSNPRSLKVGQELRLPVAVAAAVNPAPAQPPQAEAFKAPAEPLVLAPKPEAAQLAANPPAPAEPTEAKPEAGTETKLETKPAEPTTYTIRSGDSLSKIASRFGIKSGTLASANDLSTDDTLTVGKVLKVPHADGVYVKVRSGESLSHLAARYGVKASAIQEANGIADPRTLREGQTLFLPGAELRAVQRDSRRERGDFKQASRGLMGDLGRAVGKKFIWPTTGGQVSSYFGSRDGRPHHGVDIPRPMGSPIHAAKSGTVVAAGWNGDYGKCVDISHGNGVVTRYAHCSKITVKVGDEVDKGQLIGLVGDTGRATGPHLHYEVRISGRPVNPSKFHN
jgi:murein DD-endopeptidase MepM/ murein hydrolase activator NlpD